VTLNDGHTILRFASEFAHTYVRDTVTLNANVVMATHGETIQEIIGSGDARQSFQSFRLKGRPLTYISAASESGMTPALEIRVDNVAWSEVADFRDAGPDDRVYVNRHNEDGSTRIVFGDGARGARLPTGQGNVVAGYRIGAGRDGLLEADQLTLMAGKPAELKSVSNPLPPAGAADGETLAQVRVNAPATTLTLGRVVSLKDYEFYARAFAGIAKARADWVWDGTARPIILTVAGEGGAELPSSGADINNLRTALRNAGDPDVPLRIFPHEPVDFTLEADLFIEQGYDSNDVITAVNTALNRSFSFTARMLGQSVKRSGVVAVIQAVEGVKAVDLNQLYRLDQAPGNYPHLVAARPSVTAGLPDRGTELLTLSPAPVKLGIIS
jgi:predicted phage baseplate assembly protein